MSNLVYSSLAKLRALMLGVQAAIDANQIALAGIAEKPQFNMYVACAEHECGTAACAAGWAEMTGILPKGIGWHNWVVTPSQIPSKFDDFAAYFLFSDTWGRIAGLPQDVVDRIDYLVTRDQADENVIYNMRYCVQPDPLGYCPEVLAAFNEPIPSIDSILEAELEHRKEYCSI